MPKALVFSALLSTMTLAFGLTGCSSDGPTDIGNGGGGNGGGNGAGTAGGPSAGQGGSSAGASSGGRAGSGGGGGAQGGSGGNGAFTEQTSAELLASLTIGWNLGNSLDAPEGETAWGNPPATAALFQAVADAGFDLVRIPVTWSLHTGAAPDFVIEEAFMGRVEEVVNLAVDSGLYAIINVHHDGAENYPGPGVEWLTLTDAGGSISEQNNAAVRERFVAVWTQIASRFEHHGDRVLFESMNEIHVGYGPPDPGYYPIINGLNQVFVDTVRGSGGNNTLRHLVVPGYNTNIEYTVEGFQAPVDPTPDRLILSVHYYDPWNFAGEAVTQTWGAASPGADDSGQEADVVARFDKLESTFIDAGLPMIMGEYGAVQQDGFEEYRRYYMEYVTKAAVDRRIVPVYWDNGGAGTGKDAFGLFDRNSLAVLHQNVLDAMMRAATADYALADVALPAP